MFTLINHKEVNMRKLMLAVLLVGVSVAVVVLAADKPANIYIGCPDNLRVEVFPGGFNAKWNSPPNTPVNIIVMRDDEEFMRDVVNGNKYSLSGLASGRYVLLATFPGGTMSAEEHFYIPPLEYKIFQNYPNPFNPTTTIEYELDCPSHVRLSIFNSLGQEIEILVEEFQTSGSHQVIWNAGDAPSGVYYYHLVGEGISEVRKMTLLK